MMTAKHPTIKTRKRQAGLTLLELTVVLLVLIGLSGLILPYAQGYLQRTHDGTGNENLWELNNAVQLFNTKYMQYPSGLHSLIEDVAGTPTVYQDLMNKQIVTAGTLNMQSAMSLTMAGIDNVYEMKHGATNTSATFDAVSATYNIANGADVALVSTADINGDGTYGGAGETVAHHLAFAFYNNTSMYNLFDNSDGTLDGTDNCYDYVVFGVGPENEMVQRVMADAPLHFASAGGMGPDKKYNRFVLVFKVDKSNTSPCSTNTEPAKFIGSAMLMGQPHLWGAAHTQAHTYENMTSLNN